LEERFAGGLVCVGNAGAFLNSNKCRVKQHLKTSRGTKISGKGFRARESGLKGQNRVEDICDVGNSQNELRSAY